MSSVSRIQACDKSIQCGSTITTLFAARSVVMLKAVLIGLDGSQRQREASASCTVRKMYIPRWKCFDVVSHPLNLVSSTCQSNSKWESPKAAALRMPCHAIALQHCRALVKLPPAFAHRVWSVWLYIIDLSTASFMCTCV